MRLSVAAKIALSTGGAATAIIGSRAPPQKIPRRHDHGLDLRHFVDAHDVVGAPSSLPRAGLVGAGLVG